MQPYNLVEETDKICNACSIGKNTSECMRILKGLSDKECMLQKARDLAYAARNNDANQV